MFNKVGKKTVLLSFQTQMQMNQPVVGGMTNTLEF